MTRITDFHTHAFPDSLADRAIATLQADCDQARAVLDGRVSSLLASMDKSGIHRSVICSIATKPDQFGKIVKWSRSIASDRIVPLASIHPADPDLVGRAGEVADAGLKGIKLHPYYQEFVLDAPEMMPLYRELARRRLILVAHTGFDMAFPRDRICDPARISNLLRQVPDLLLVTTHFGSWQDWGEVRRHLLGRPVYMEISYTLCQLPREEARELLMSHPADKVLFGTDSPWRDQGEALALLRGLNLPADVERLILEGNASALLESAGA
jgi:predicted TIM-barrel fold metal-dependent hydrolase